MLIKKQLKESFNSKTLSVQNTIDYIDAISTSGKSLYYESSWTFEPLENIDMIIDDFANITVMHNGEEIDKFYIQDFYTILIRFPFMEQLKFVAKHETNTPTYSVFIR